MFEYYILGFASGLVVRKIMDIIAKHIHDKKVRTLEIYLKGKTINEIEDEINKFIKECHDQDRKNAK